MGACEEQSNLDAAKKFFQKQQIGDGQDWGVFKWGKDHVASVHGFMDDYQGCETFAKALNREACAESRRPPEECANIFQCRPLN